MEHTRVDTKKFRGAVADVVEALTESRKALGRFITLLTPEQRATLLRGREGVLAAAPALARRVQRHASLVTQTEFDPAAVLEDCDNLQTLTELQEAVSGLQQLLDDARLQWEAEVMVPVLEFYGAAQHPARKDAELAETIAPLRKALSTPRREAKPAE